MVYYLWWGGSVSPVISSLSLHYLLSLEEQQCSLCFYVQRCYWYLVLASTIKTTYILIHRQWKSEKLMGVWSSAVCECGVAVYTSGIQSVLSPSIAQGLILGNKCEQMFRGEQITSIGQRKADFGLFIQQPVKKNPTPYSFIFRTA